MPTPDGFERDTEPQMYIVQLTDRPVATYQGGVQGIAATKPASGDKVDAESAPAVSYADYLVSEQDDVLESVGLSADDKAQEYTVAFNGFAAVMTAQQAETLRKSADVANVWEDEVRQVDTISTPDYLGLTGDGVWNQQFGGEENAGSGTVIGIIDTGVWPENPSFGPLAGDPAPPATWSGECVEGVDPDPEDNIECNSKVIGARFYPPPASVSPDEFQSPRDYNGHGSHVGSTSGGNFGVPVSIGGVDVGTASGMAPAAHLSFYKALWQTGPGSGSGITSSLVAAIDDATADGVDVINYSVSGSSQFVVTPDELAFLNAADAGVFVSTSAGNSGDTVGESSVAHNSPWTITVAASTHDRNVNKILTLLGEGVLRVAGEDRYGTAAEIAALYPEGVDTVYIATGDQFADALSGASAASQGLVPTSGLARPAVTPDGDPAPVLLVRQGGIPGPTVQALEAIDPDNIVILGGPVAVSDQVETDLEAYGDVSRVAGKDRYQTSALIAQMYDDVDHVYVASGDTINNAFADALSGAALAGSEQVPVLLTRPDAAPQALLNALDELGDPEVRILGGSEAVSDDVFAELGAAERIAGKTRYDTSAAIAARFGYGEGNPAPIAHVATGLTYPDALAGSALAGFQDAPVVLTRPAEVPAGVMNALIEADPEVVAILGGLQAVNQSAEDQLNAVFGTPDQEFQGVGVGEAVGPAPLVDSEDIPAEGATAEDARLCFPGSLDAAQADGHIVICTRGVSPRVEKSATVADAGGIGMILANNTEAESLNADFHSVPSIHVGPEAGEAAKAAADAGAEGAISADGQGEVIVPEMAGFSSYGPAIAGDGDLLKPDITAPGVDVIAAVAPPGNGGEDFFAYSGTSMSAPHIAGLGALMRQKYPDWSVAAIKSAMMTTADPLNSEGENINYAGEPANALHYGAGEVEPGASYGTGLVYDAGFVDWVTYACAINQLQLVTAPGACDAFAGVDPSDLNYPSISIGALGGEQTVTRTVTNVTDTEATYTASVEAPDGVAVTVSPETFTVAAGAEATYEVTFTVTDADLEEWTFGSLTWEGEGLTDVRSPIALYPVGIAAPAELVETGVEGSAEYDVVSGFNGVLTTTPTGLITADTTAVDVTSDGTEGGGSIADAILPVTVPDGASAIRVEIFDAETSLPGRDMDLYLATAEGAIIAQSAAGGSDEQVTLPAPPPGDYVVVLDFWDGEEGEVITVPTNVYVPVDDAGNMTVTPSPTPVVAGESETLTVEWSGLDAGERYFGAAVYSDGTDVVGETLVTIITE